MLQRFVGIRSIEGILYWTHNFCCYKRIIYRNFYVLWHFLVEKERVEQRSQGEYQPNRQCLNKIPNNIIRDMRNGIRRIIKIFAGTQFLLLSVTRNRSQSLIRRVRERQREEEERMRLSQGEKQRPEKSVEYER